jgi:glycosyltransferase involved in cell wall biosynthesis
MSRLSVVLPAYNEELMVGKTCRVLHDVLAEAGISYELVVVDDGSKDKTWEEITKAGDLMKQHLEDSLQYALSCL